MRYIAYLFVLCFYLSCNPKQEPQRGIAYGVPFTLMEQRAKSLENLIYNLQFVIPNTIEAPIVAHEKLTFDFKGTQNLYLDFKENSDHLKKLIVNGSEIKILHRNEHIEIPFERLNKGKNQIEIDFLAGELSLNRNEEYLYTLLVPDRARTLFPCFDQPNIKAVYNLNITAPETWDVLCAAPEINQVKSNGFIAHQFGSSDKMSTYLFSFVAGKFKSENKQIENFPMRMFYRETDEEKINYSLDTIFQLHNNAKNFLKTYTDYPFPFQKLDFAAIPGFQYGGMEHIGAVQYRESSLFLDESATENRKLSRAKLIAHETSHMWFGDLVTMNWFNDVWMKEVFANFMADKIVNPAFPSINHDLAFMVGHYPSAYAEDRTKGTNPIRQDLDNLNNAGSLYGSIIYNKAPIMMRQLEAVLGKDKFRQGIQEYIATYQNSNADWNNLIQILDKKSAVDLLAWSKVWVNSSGRPIFKDSISYDNKGNISSFKIYQKAEDNSENIWPQNFQISMVYPEDIQTITVDINNKSTNLTEMVGKPKPTTVIYNSNGMGYGVFPMGLSSLEAARKLKGEVSRGSLYINAYENTLNGNISPSELLKFYEDRLYLEDNELLVNLLSGYLRSIFWKYLSTEEQLLEQPLLTDRIWFQLESNIRPNKKKTLFTIFRSLAYTGKSRELLYDIWSKNIVIADLKLNKDDYTEMAMNLALYNHPEKEHILKTAKEAIDNPDKLERFIFLLPSLSNDVNIKSKFINSLQNEKNRSKESWTATALNHINHPLHEKYALKHLRGSLDLLDEIQKTGDIFFPKRWLSSTIGNHTTPEAYQILTDYLESNPELNPSLKSKLWQAADDLSRVQLMRKKVDKSLN